MSNEETLARLNTLVGDLLEIDDPKLSADMSAQDVPKWDSLAHVRIVVAVEQAFKMRFSTREITSLKTIGDLVKLIEKHSSAP
jgi:acyl carrier protein